MTATILETVDDAWLANCSRQHWLDMGVTEADVAPDWKKHFLDFVAAARARRAFAGFAALEDEGPVGCACCHLVERVYPVFQSVDPAAVGYVWGVYVRPEARGRGVGTALVRACINRLMDLGCGRILLHAGEQARPVYERLGFKPTNEFALEIDQGGTPPSAVATNRATFPAPCP